MECTAQLHSIICRNTYLSSTGATGAQVGHLQMTTSARLCPASALMLLMRFLHLNNSETQPRRGDPAFDKLYKVRPFLDIILDNFKCHYQPFQHHSIDESMISFKGRLCFIQYLPKKPHKWGLKAWVLADSSNGTPGHGSSIQARRKAL